jgi:transcriptional regulator with XRE-family HTH domain
MQRHVDTLAYTLGLELRRRRTTCGLTQLQVSESLNKSIGVPEISLHENGRRRMTVNHLYDLAAVYSSRPSTILATVEQHLAATTPMMLIDMRSLRTSPLPQAHRWADAILAHHGHPTVVLTPTAIHQLAVVWSVPVATVVEFLRAATKGPGTDDQR